MMWRNSQARYGWVAIVLHWISAVMVVGLFVSGLWMAQLDYYDAWYHRAPYLHKSFGLLFLVIVGFRLLWKMTNPIPVMSVSSRIQHASIRLVHGLLYVLMLSVPVSGYFLATSEGEFVDVFGLFAISVIVEFDNSGDVISLIHEYLAWAFIVLAAFHVLAALKHHFVDKDATLLKILGKSR